MLATGLTFHLGLELTVEQIHHDGTVPAEVVLPCLEAWTHTQTHTYKHSGLWGSHNTNPANPSPQDNQNQTDHQYSSITNLKESAADGLTGIDSSVLSSSVDFQNGHQRILRLITTKYLRGEGG